jgi:hypothetical protein
MASNSIFERSNRMAEPKQAPIAATQPITITLDANNKVQVDNPYLKIGSTDSIQFTNHCSGSTVSVNFLGSGNGVFNGVSNLPYPNTSPAQSPKSNANNLIADYTVTVTVGSDTYQGGPYCIAVGAGPLAVELHYDPVNDWQADPDRGQIPGIGDKVQFINRDRHLDCEVTFDGGFSPVPLPVPKGGQGTATALQTGQWDYQMATPSKPRRVGTSGGGTVGVGGTGTGGPGGGKKR